MSSAVAMLVLQIHYSATMEFSDADNLCDAN